MLRHYVRRASNAAVQFIFARRQFKLFLRVTLGQADLRMHALAAATSFFSTMVRPVIIEAPFGSSVLVLAPHQDDEVIGCGGAMALQCRSGRGLQVVVLQDGADEHAQVFLTREELRERRNAESRAAARVIDAEVPLFLGKRNLREDVETTAASLRDCIESRKVDVVFTPFALDGDRDHRASNVILARALMGVKRRIRVLQYEVWAHCIPNVVVVIDGVVEQKEKMLTCFEFANSAVNYTHAVMGLGMSRSRLLPAGRARYVEAYFETPKEEFLDIMQALEAAERKAQRPSDIQA